MAANPPPGVMVGVRQTRAVMVVKAAVAAVAKAAVAEAMTQLEATTPMGSSTIIRSTTPTAASLRS